MLANSRSDDLGLFVPAASIALGSAELDMREAYSLVFTQLEIDLQLSVSGQFRFTIPDVFDLERREFLTPSKQPLLPLLALGTRVWVFMGYGDSKKQVLLMSGFITAVGTGFAEGASPELEVSGTDATYLLTLGTSEHRFENKSVQDAVAEVARQAGMRLVFDGTPPAGITLDNNLQTDLEFIGKMAQNFSTPEKKWEFYARATRSGDQLHFGPRRKDAAPVCELAREIDLLSFKPEANLGNQVAKVEVLGWDEVRKQKILGTATRPGGQGSSGGDLQRRAFGREAVLQLRYPVKTQAEADQRAAAELATRANNLVKGEGETLGFPDLLPDTNVRLAGLGAQFSQTYYVTKTVHRFDSSGYRTRFSVERAVA